MLCTHVCNVALNSKQQKKTSPLFLTLQYDPCILAIYDNAIQNHEIHFRRTLRALERTLQ